MFRRRWPELSLVLLALCAAPYFRGGPALMLLAALLLPMVAALRSPSWCLTLLLFAAPLVDGLINLLFTGAAATAPAGHPASWLEVLGLGAAMGLLLHRLRSSLPDRRVHPALTLLLCAVGCSLAWSLLRHAATWRGAWPEFLILAWSSLPQVAAMPSEQTLRAGLLMLAGPGWFLLLLRSLPHAVAWRRPAAGWLAGAACTAVYGTVAWWAGHDNQWPFVRSFIEDRNAYASYLLMTLGVSAAFMADAPTRRGRAAGMISAALALWMLLLSGSKIGLAAAVLVAAWAGTMCWLHGSRRQRRLAVAAVSVSLVLLTLGALLLESSPIGLTLRRVGTPGFLGEYMGANRLPVWEAAFQAAWSHPWLGLGPGLLYRQLGNFYSPTETDAWQPAHENAHNGFLQIAAEAGWLSLAAYLWIVLALLLPALRGSGAWRGPPGLLAAGAAGFLCTMLTGHPLLLARQSFLFWSLLALLAVIPQPARREGATLVQSRGADTFRRRIPGLPWPALVAAILLTGAASMQPFRLGCAATPPGEMPLRWDFASGFYAEETDGGGRWRWMKSAGEIRACSEMEELARQPSRLVLSSFATPRQLEGPGFKHGTVTVEEASASYGFQVPPLQAGQSLTFAATPGARPVHRVAGTPDSRSLALRFALGDDGGPFTPDIVHQEPRP